VNVDYRAMLVKYVALVCNAEGVDFLDEYDWTPEEWQAFEALDAEITATIAALRARELAP
jgi:hypothetical protein